MRIENERTNDSRSMMPRISEEERRVFKDCDDSNTTTLTCIETRSREHIFKIGALDPLVECHLHGSSKRATAPAPPVRRDYGKLVRWMTFRRGGLLLNVFIIAYNARARGGIHKEDVFRAVFMFDYNN